MNMGEILGWSGGTLLLLMTFVQIAPIKVNPWSWLAKKIGRAINGEVLNEIADIKKEQRETQDKLEKHIQDDDERDASMHRQRILRFNIELMRGEDFTHECFNDTRRIAIRRIVNDRVCHCSDLRIKHYLLMPTIDDISISIRKEALQVKKEYTSFSSIASVMPCKLLC